MPVRSEEAIAHLIGAQFSRLRNSESKTSAFVLHASPTIVSSEAIARVMRGQAKFRGIQVLYGREVEEEIAKLDEAIASDEALEKAFLGKYSARWLAVSTSMRPMRPAQPTMPILNGAMSSRPS